MTALARRALLTLGLATLASFGSARAQDDNAIEQPVEGLYAGLESVMRSGRSTPFPKRFSELAPAVERVFDLDMILKVSVGLRWGTMDGQAQARLLRAFRRFTIATYVASFDRYDGERFKILPGLHDLGRDRIVRTEIISGSDERFRVDYVMRDTGGAWRAIDVLLDGTISRVAVQRSDFRKILAGGDAEALIASLQRKIADLSDGTLTS
jgi:phospholipid transport system substrate-binding protein